MITNGPDISVIEGTEVTVTCKSYRGKPAATITWIDKDGKEIEKDEKKENIEDSSEEVDATKLHNAASTVKLKLGKEEHNKNLTCQTTHEAYCSGEADSCPVSTTILMLVKYAPELTITQVDRRLTSFCYSLPGTSSVFRRRRHQADVHGRCQPPRGLVQVVY